MFKASQNYSELTQLLNNFQYTFITNVTKFDYHLYDQSSENKFPHVFFVAIRCSKVNNGQYKTQPADKI